MMVSDNDHSFVERSNTSAGMVQVCHRFRVCTPRKVHGLNGGQELQLSILKFGWPFERRAGLVRIFNVQAAEMLGFTTAVLSGVAALIHLVSIQIVMHDRHLPTCGPSDKGCAETYDMVIIM